MAPLDPAQCLPATRNHLQSLGLLVLDEWILQCLQFLVESTNPPPATLQAIFPLVVTQLLHTDLGQIGLSTVPPALAAFETQNAVLAPTASVVLQIMAIDEVGHSVLSVVHALEALVAYSEAEAARADAAAHNGPQPTPAGRRCARPTIPRKMLKLTLTDGHVTLFGMEYKSMPFLSLLTPLGAKIRVRNAPCSRGVVRLTPQNTELVGGDVEELVCDIRALITRLYAKLGIQPPNTRHVARVDRVDPHAMQFLIEPPGPEDLEDLDPPPPPPLLLLGDEQQQQDQDRQPEVRPPVPGPGAAPAPPPPFLQPPLVLPPRQPMPPPQQRGPSLPPPPPTHYPTPPAFHPGDHLAGPSVRAHSPPRPVFDSTETHGPDNDDDLFDETWDDIPDDVLAQADLLASQRRTSVRDPHTAHMAAGVDAMDGDAYMDADDDDDGFDYSLVPDVGDDPQGDANATQATRRGPRLDADFIPLDDEDLFNWPAPGPSGDANHGPSASGDDGGVVDGMDGGADWGYFDDFYVPPDAVGAPQLEPTTSAAGPPLASPTQSRLEPADGRAPSPGLSQQFAGGFRGLSPDRNAEGTVYQVPSPGLSSGDPVGQASHYDSLKRCTLEEVPGSIESTVLVTNAQMSSIGISLQYKPNSRKRAIRVIVPLSPAVKSRVSASQPSSSFKAVTSSAPAVLKAVIDEAGLRALGVDIDAFKRTKNLASISAAMTHGITQVLMQTHVRLTRLPEEDMVWELDVESQR